MAQSQGENAARGSGSRWQAVLLVLAALVLSTGCTSDDGEDTIGDPEVTAGAASGPPYSDVELVGGVTVDHPDGRLPTSVDWSWKVDGVDSGIRTREVPPSETTRGQVWEVSAVVSFGLERVGPGTGRVTVVNKPPDLFFSFEDMCDTSTSVPPDFEFSGTTTVIVTPVDIDGDPATVVDTYVWQRAVRNVPTQELNFQRVRDIPEDATTVNCNDLYTRSQRRFPSTKEYYVRVVAQGQDPFEKSAAMTSQEEQIGLGPMPATLAELVVPEPAVVRSARASVSGTSVGTASRTPSITSGLLVAAAGGSTGGSDGSAGGSGSGSGAGNDGAVSIDLADELEGRALSITEANVCNITGAGSLDCDGSPAFGVDDPPEGSFLEVAIQEDYGCAIRAGDLGIVCWGEPDEDLGQLAAPEGAFTQIELTELVACALRTSGEIACWGDDALGQASPPEGAYRDLRLSSTYGCAIDAEDEVVCWGQVE